MQREQSLSGAYRCDWHRCAGACIAGMEGQPIRMCRPPAAACVRVLCVCGASGTAYLQAHVMYYGFAASAKKHQASIHAVHLAIRALVVEVYASIL